MKDFQYITAQHPQYVENLYKDFLQNPDSVDPDLRKFFEGFDFAVANGSKSATVTIAETSSSLPPVNWEKEIGVYRLILGYRNKGHLIATTNPIRKRKDRGADLSLNFYGLSEQDLSTTFNAGKLIGLGKVTLSEILAFLQKTYTSQIGAEFKYITDQRKIDFLTSALEKEFHQPLPLKKRKRILEKLNQGVIFEGFLHKKYIGQKILTRRG